MQHVEADHGPFAAASTLEPRQTRACLQRIKYVPENQIRARDGLQSSDCSTLDQDIWISATSACRHEGFTQVAYLAVLWGCDSADHCD